MHQAGDLELFIFSCDGNNAMLNAEQNQSKVPNDKMAQISLFAKGVAMGAADVVPGVSGGTIAFISGIYEKLIGSISRIDFSLWTRFRDSGFAGVWQYINGTFLLVLFSGILLSILSFARLITYLLATYPEIVWAFFMGLILAGAVYIGRQIVKWDALNGVILLVGIAVAYGITTISPANLGDSPLLIFLAGVIAISAMILPGISGSFILLLMGMYSVVLDAVTRFDIMVMLIFALGCGVGLLIFSKVLTWLFNHFKWQTLALLTGFMLGSLNKVWPWKETISTRINSKGETVPFIQDNVMPATYSEITGQDPQIIMIVAAILIGFILVWGLERLAQQESL